MLVGHLGLTHSNPQADLHAILDCKHQRAGMLCRIAHNGQDDGGQEGQRHTQLRAGLCNVRNIQV